MRKESAKIVIYIQYVMRNGAKNNSVALKERCADPTLVA